LVYRLTVAFELASESASPVVSAKWEKDFAWRMRREMTTIVATVLLF
jgi:hypothetical protein